LYPKEEKNLKAQSSNIEPSTRKILHKFGAQKIVVVRERIMNSKNYRKGVLGRPEMMKETLMFRSILNLLLFWKLPTSLPWIPSIRQTYL
jgi:hypothetical protein